MLEQNREMFTRFGILDWHEKGYKGEGLTIAVLDGVGLQNDYMEGNFYCPFSDVSGTGHITNVAHVIAQGLPNAKIVLLPYSGYSEKDKSFDWIAENKPDIVNCSFVAESFFINPRMERIKDKTIIICASGNEGKDRIPSPAKLPFTICTGSFSYGVNSVHSKSNYGKELDCLCPTNVNVIGGTGKVFPFVGTSAAAPMLSVAVGLYIQYMKKYNISYDVETIRKWVHDNSSLEAMKHSHEKAGKGLFTMPKVEDIPVDKPIPEVPKEDEVMFKDVKETDWFHKAVKWAKEKGLLKGYSDGKFRPDQPLTRAEYAQAEYNKAHKEG